jgi:hypothetical protein
MRYSSWLTLILRREYCANNATPFAAAARWTSCTLRGVASEIVGRCIQRDIYSFVTETTMCVLLLETCSRHVSLYDRGKNNLLR